MKKNIIKLFVLTSLTIGLNGCKDKAKEADTKDAEVVAVTEVSSEKYIVNTDLSTIEWKGFKPTGSHNGLIKLENGVLNMTDGNLSSGTFLIDMNSIEVVDIPKDKKGNANLVNHLKHADFFDVEKHPSAAFEVTGLELIEGKTMLSGNLTLKEVKNNVTFPVTVTNENGAVILTSEAFSIDRTKWNVQYGSKSIFKDLGDKFINDDIELKIMVKATKS